MSTIATYRVESLASESEDGVRTWTLAPIHGGPRVMSPPPATGLDLAAACTEALLGSRGGLARVVNEATGMALDASQLLALRGTPEVQP